MADNISESENKDDSRVTSEFKNAAINYVAIGDKISELNSELRILRKEKKECETILLDNLNKLDENVIQLENVKLQKNQSKNIVSLNEKHVREALEDKISDKSIVDEIMKNMNEKRGFKTYTNIKRTQKRK